MSSNKLKLNEDKTELLIILLCRQTHKCNIESLSIGGCEIKSSGTVRNLGVIFDNTMLLKSQINNVVKNCHFHLREIGKIRTYLSTEAASSLIHAFISSRLDYGNSLLCGMPDTDLNKLQKVQNTAARILTKTKKYDHISPVLQELHWLKVKQRIEYKICSLTYKCLNDLAPSYLAELIHPSRNSNLRSGNQYMLEVPRARPFYGERAFQYAAPSLWNNLPISVKSATSLESFKTKLKTHLFSV